MAIEINCSDQACTIQKARTPNLSTSICRRPQQFY